MSAFDASELSRDAFLGGRLHLWQPQQGYRAGVDPVLLAASVPARDGQSVLDLGCGAGAVALCLGTRVAGLTLIGLEREPRYAALAERNGQEAELDFTVMTGDVQNPPKALTQMSFDHVVSNPPYYDRGRGSKSDNTAREAALGEDVALSDWIKCAFKRLKPKGYVHFVLKADRLADVLASAAAGFGSLEVQPLAPRTGRDAELIILRARKDGRAALRLHAPIILHDGAAHPGDKDHYAPAISEVLRRGKALKF